MRRLASAAVLATLMATGCAGEGYGPRGQLEQEFPNLAIERIGDFSVAYKDYQDLAVLNAADYAVAAGVPRTALREAAVTAVGGFGIAQLGGPLGYPSYYEVWLKVEGCGSRLHVMTSFTGRVISAEDPGGCLG